MEKSRLGAKQKRYLDFKNSLNEFDFAPEIKVDLEANLTQYKNVLAKIWESSQASAQDLDQLADIERRLETSFEDGRASNQLNKID